jgi:2'-5' RNA ligase
MTKTPDSAPREPTSRFFIALIPPADVQAEATRLKEYCRDRYHSQAALRSPPHITLQAPFEWPDSDRDRLIQTLAKFQFPVSPVPITLSGFGAFPPRVIYVNVEPTAELMSLQPALSRYVAATLTITDPRSRSRSFHPHLTIAFRDLKPAAFRRAWSEFEAKAIEFACEIPAITLLVHTGHQWIIHQHFPL